MLVRPLILHLCPSITLERTFERDGIIFSLMKSQALQISDDKRISRVRFRRASYNKVNHRLVLRHPLSITSALKLAINCFHASWMRYNAVVHVLETMQRWRRRVLLEWSTNARHPPVRQRAPIPTLQPLVHLPTETPVRVLPASCCTMGHVRQHVRLDAWIHGHNCVRFVKVTGYKLPIKNLFSLKIFVSWNQAWSAEQKSQSTQSFFPLWRIE